jgi:hypothetical protein
VATMPTASASAQGAGKEGRDLVPCGEQARDVGGRPERGCLGLMGGKERCSSFKHFGVAGTSAASLSERRARLFVMPNTPRARV